MPELDLAPLLHPAPSPDARGIAQRYVDRVLGQVRQQYRQFDQLPYRTWVFTCVVGAVMLWLGALTEYLTLPPRTTLFVPRVLAPLLLGGWFAGMALRHRRFDKAFRPEAEFSLLLSLVVFTYMVQVNGIRPVMILFGSTISMYIAQRRWVARLGVLASLAATALAAQQFTTDQALFWRAMVVQVACACLMEWLMRLVDRAMATLGDASHSLDALSQELVADRARLVEAMSRAELEAQRKGDLMATVSHEIRTPMQAILGLSALMAEAPVTPQQQEWLARIRENGQHLVGIVSDLLDYTRIQAGKAALEQGPFHLDDVVAHVRDVLERTGQEKGLAVSLTVDDDVPRQLLGDRRRLTQLFLNYVTNAVKYTERGAVKVTVSATNDDAQIMLRVQVVDTGIGMTPEQQVRCFEPYEREFDEPSPMAGIGLGLPICRWIAAQMQGRVGVSSTRGVGSTFWFEVQLRQADMVTRERPAPVVRGVPALAGVRALVVDDSRINRVVVGEALRRRGVEVTEAVCGQSALDQLTAAAFDVVVMDVQMPGMDGIEAARRAHMRLGDRCPPIIGMTASVMARDEARCYHAGMVAFLAKPFDPEQLVQEVARRTGRMSPPVIEEGASSGAIGALSAVRGLDVVGGLRRMAGDEVTYRALLREMVRDHADTVPRIAAQLAAGDRASATTLVHAWSGTCAILGATEVRGALRTLEGLLVDGAPMDTCQTALEAAAVLFGVLRDDLGVALPNESDAAVLAS